MKRNSPLNRVPRPVRQHPVISAAAGAALVLAIVWFNWPTAKEVSTGYHEVRRSDFTVTVVEAGTVAAVRETIIRNEVEGVARIIWIIPEGSDVKKGDLLVELDSAQARDQLNLQLINYEKAKFAVEQAKAQLEILKSTTNSDFMTVELKLRFAKVDHEKYDRGQLMIDLVEASNKLVQVDAQLTVNLETYINSTNLAAKGYETKQKVDADRLSVLNNKNSLIVASNSIWILQEFDVPKQRDKYDADVLQAEQELQRVISQNARKVAQAEADLNAQINTLRLNDDKLKRDQKNLDATKVYAPQDGLVVYAVTEGHFSSESLIEGGATVRNRQDLIKLPDLARMKVNIKVHESHVNLIRPGLPAFVVLDSMPDQRFAGVVEKVAPLPDTQTRFGNPNLKVYNTEIHLTDRIPKIKPGVSAKAEIIITNIDNALSVPIQAVTAHKGKPVVYVLNGGRTEARPVEVGMYNTKFIEINQGLKPGERVLLSPPFEQEQKDIEGGVLADGERIGASRPKQPAEQTRSRETPSNGSEHDSSAGAEGSRNGHSQDNGERQPSAPQGASRDDAGGGSSVTGRAP